MATQHGRPVRPRGAGTNLAAATVAEQGGIVLVLTRLNRILEVSADELLLRAQAGVTTAAVAGAAAGIGLCYPPDPGSHMVSTIGGNVAMCAGGLRGLKYGVTRNYVLGCEAVLPTGEVIRTGGRLWKDVAGYDLTRLLTGSEGTLAVVTEVTVALLPAKAVALTGLAWFESLADAGRAVAAIIRGGTLPATLEFLDRTCINAVEDYAHLGLHRDAGALLLFGDDGTAEAVDAVALDHGGQLRTGRCPERRHRVATSASSAETAGRPALLAACLAPGSPATMLEDVSVAARRSSATMVGGHRGDRRGARRPLRDVRARGRRQPPPDDRLRPADTGSTKHRAEPACGRVFAGALELGGTLTGEHGIGAAKLPWLERRLGADQVALIRRIKTAFDPAGILNPGKLAVNETTGMPGHERRAESAFARDAACLSRAIFDPRLLDAWIACGFCLPACPTYAETKRESSSPRGRITLMRALEEGRLDVDFEPLQRAGVVLPWLPRLRDRVPGRGPVRRTARAMARRHLGGRHTPPLAVALRGRRTADPGLVAAGRVTPSAPTRSGAPAADRPHPHARLRGAGPSPRRLARGRAAARRASSTSRPDRAAAALHAHSGAMRGGRGDGAGAWPPPPGDHPPTAGGCARAYAAHVLGRERVRGLSDYLAERWTDPGGPGVPELRRLWVDGRRAGRAAGLLPGCGTALGDRWRSRASCWPASPTMSSCPHRASAAAEPGPARCCPRRCPRTVVRAEARAGPRGADGLPRRRSTRSASARWLPRSSGRG